MEDQEPRDADDGDELEADIMQADHAFGSESVGTTVEEELAGESLDQRLAEERPDRSSVDEVLSVIAEGTSDELKDRIGGEVLELHVERQDEVSLAAEALAGVGAGEPYVDADARIIRVPVGDAGSAVLLESTRRLDERKIALAGFALHRPTLDDVFLSLTGHAAEDGSEPEPAKKGRRGRRKEKES